MYQPISHEEDTADDGDDEVFSPVSSSTIEPLEIVSADPIESTEYMAEPVLFTWSNPWPLSFPVFMLLIVPALIGTVCVVHEITGKWWATSLMLLHLSYDAFVARLTVIDDEVALESCWVRFFTSMGSVIDLVAFGLLYPLLWGGLSQYMYTDIDGTDVLEWTAEKKQFMMYGTMGNMIFTCRLLTGMTSILARLGHLRTCRGFLTTIKLKGIYRCSRPWSMCSYWVSLKSNARKCIGWLHTVFAFVSTGITVAGIFAALQHILPNGGHRVNPKSASCNPIDTTECSLPYPSFHHMVPDNSTETGWRVNLRPEVFPPLRVGARVNPDFVNRLDGFSTMAPLLFYMDGLKEAHEAGVNQLQGLESIAKSVTADSVTLLVDVDAAELVPHSAEIDYLDPKRPLVLVFPAQPLKHNTHYALAVVNARDKDGTRLKPTLGMQMVSSIAQGDNLEEWERYSVKLTPALMKAAPWVPLKKDPFAIQLMFDFITISESSQLGPTRAVRDGVLQQVSSWEWKDHVRVNKIVDRNSCKPGYPLARTIHAELDVPWFLESFGPGQRASRLDSEAVRLQQSGRIGVAKFVVHVPCSVKDATVGKYGKKVRAVMEFGHGLFFSRDEASDDFLIRMAHEEGYVIIAMDWRGMSVFDLPTVVRTLMAEPSLFESIRDNLIQGYGNKYALQHFARNGLFEMDAMRFNSKSIQFRERKGPSYVFYGISQGGILGAGYTALSGVTGLIDRGILGVPGTPFVLILSRSLKFLLLYDNVLLLNFQNNRHVRIFLSIVQSAWDPVEASAALAPPIREPVPRLLLQAGLGDNIVPSVAAEALARGLNARLLPYSPRDVFGLTTGKAADGSQDGPNATFTELMYDDVYKSLPEKNIASPSNNVHFCVRRDPAMVKQVVEFINSGRVLDPCVADGCHRKDHGC